MRKLGIIFWLGAILLIICSATAEERLAAVVDEVELNAGRYAMASAHSQALSTAQAAPEAQPCASCEKPGDCCPSWANYLEFDYLMMSRSNGLGNQPLVVDSLDRDQVLMGAHDFDFGLAPGLRVLAGQRRDSGPGWEIGYTGIFNAFAEEAFSGGAISAPGDLALQLDGWTTAAFIRPTYQSSLHLAEANAVWSTCCVSCRPDALLPWKQREHCVCTDLMAGFVWAGLNEQANYNLICCPGDPVSTYGVSTMSNLYGLQLGLRRRADWERWSLQTTLKAAVAWSDLQSESTSVFSTLAQSGNPNDPLVTVRDPIQLSDGDLSGIFQFNITAIYRINTNLGLRVGYNLIGLTDIALAADQWDFTDTVNSGRSLDGTGDVLFHGANFGLEYRW
jgi:hypothetical protein